jgi:hypothetical protein
MSMRKYSVGDGYVQGVEDPNPFETIHHEASQQQWTDQDNQELVEENARDIKPDTED